MARDVENFRDVVNRRSQFYESIDIQTIAVEQDSNWYNLHTDVHIRPEEPNNLSVSTTELLGPAAYFRNVVSFKHLWELMEEMFTDQYILDGYLTIFPGLSDEEGDQHWKENIYRAHYREYDRADDAYGILIQSNADDPLPDKTEFQEKLRKLDPPYYDINDLCREYLGHTSYNWSKPQARFFAPLYVKIMDHKITESGNLKLRIQTHDSIQNPVVSTWARKDHEIIDRERHTPIETQSLDGSFHQFEINWEIKGNPTDVSTSMFHSVFDQIEDSTRLSSSVPMIALETVLGKTSEELSNDFDQILRTPDKETLNNIDFADDFEATVITLFNLVGFSAYSPEWYDYKTSKGSLPDMLAYSPADSTLVVCECTLADTDNKVKIKANDALASTRQIEDKFDEIDLIDPIVIPVCATPTNTVSSVILPKDVEILTGPKLQAIRQQAKQSNDPKNVLREWDTYDEKQGIR